MMSSTRYKPGVPRILTRHYTTPYLRYTMRALGMVQVVLVSCSLEDSLQLLQLICSSLTRTPDLTLPSDMGCVPKVKVAKK